MPVILNDPFLESFEDKLRKLRPQKRLYDIRGQRINPHRMRDEFGQVLPGLEQFSMPQTLLELYGNRVEEFQYPDALPFRFPYGARTPK